MNDYISIQEVIEKIEERGREKFTLDPAYLVYLRALQDVENDLRHMPAVDAVPVVRCKDCRLRDTINCGMQFYRYDDDMILSRSEDWTHNDGFCYWGERKDKGKYLRTRHIVSRLRKSNMSMIETGTFQKGLIGCQKSCISLSGECKLLRAGVILFLLQKLLVR